jgi:glycerophosphoryl diester phosphodiesterase
MATERRSGRPLLLAHRGDHRLEFENTLAAFEAAAALPGCDGVELDVRLARDGEAIVLHDATLARVQDIATAARDLSSLQLAAYGVPCLADVLAAIPRTSFIDVELKEAAIEPVVAALAANRRPDDGTIAVSSFDPAILERFGGVAPEWPRWLIASHAQPALSIARESGCRGLALDVAAMDRSLVDQCHQAEIMVMAWTVRDRATRRRLTAMGVDAICAEGPALDG